METHRSVASVVGVVEVIGAAASRVGAEDLTAAGTGVEKERVIFSADGTETSGASVHLHAEVRVGHLLLAVTAAVGCGRCSGRYTSCFGMLFS